MSPVNFVPAPDQGDAQVVVLGVELHPEVVTILLVSTIFEDLVAEGLFEREDAKLKIEDDLGTEYRRALQIGMGSKWVSSNGSVDPTSTSSRPSRRRRPVCGSRSAVSAASP